MDYKAMIVNHCEYELKMISDTEGHELPVEMVEYKKRYEDFLRNEIKINTIK